MIVMALLLAMAFSGCTGSERAESDSGNGGDNHTVGSNQTDNSTDVNNGTNNTSSNNVMELYMTGRKISEFEGNVVVVPVTCGATHEFAMAKPTGADEKIAASTSRYAEAWPTIWYTKLNESVNVGTIKLHFWISYDLPDIHIGGFQYAIYKNDTCVFVQGNTVSNFLTVSLVVPAIAECSAEIQINKSIPFAANDLFGIGIVFFGNNLYQNPTVHFLAGAEHPSCALVNTTKS
ncbi:MAG: hypothetical protein CVT47_02035 [Thermoplasmata archaeon HGW-Thermoplasmata-2]|nr:MAG: hypothetical protein CVT47_02035 [Thermoplasmata archaeon HGW-Thermoplasmata-2]